MVQVKSTHTVQTGKDPTEAVQERMRLADVQHPMGCTALGCARHEGMDVMAVQQCSMSQISQCLKASADTSQTSRTERQLFVFTPVAHIATAST